LTNCVEFGASIAFSTALIPWLELESDWGANILFRKTANCREPMFWIAAGLGGGGSVNEVGRDTVED
jgi:hypothetical protein